MTDGHDQTSASILNVDDCEAGALHQIAASEAIRLRGCRGGNGAEALRKAEELQPCRAAARRQTARHERHRSLRASSRRNGRGSWCCRRPRHSPRPRTASAASNGGADSYLIQPVEPEELVAAVRAFLRIRAAEDELRRLNETLEATRPGADGRSRRRQCAAAGTRSRSAKGGGGAGPGAEDGGDRPADRRHRA